MRFIQDRIELLSLLVVLCFLSVLTLESQSAASYPSYALALTMLFTIRSWNDVFGVNLGWAVLLLIAYLCATSIWSDPFDAGEMRSIWARGLLVFCFVVGLAECQLRGVVQRWLGRAMAVAGGIVVLAALARFLIEQPDDGRLNGFGQLDTHVVAALIYGVVLIFNIEIFLTEKSIWWRLFSLVSALLVVCAVFLSDSRNAWVSVIAGASVYLFSHRARDPRQFALGILVIGLIIAVVLAGLWVNEETKDIVLPRGDSFRLFIWQATLERLHGLGLVFGLGITTNDDVQVNKLLFEHPHNMYLALLFQGGILAFLLFWVVVVGCLRVLLRHYHRNDAKLALGILALALLSYLLDGHELVDKVGETWFLFWLPVGLSLGLRWSQPTLEH